MTERIRTAVMVVIAITAVAFGMLVIMGEDQPTVVDGLASIAGLGVGLLIALSAGAGEHGG